MFKVTFGKRQYSYTDQDGKKHRSWYYQARWVDENGRDTARSLKTQDAHEARNLTAEIERQLNEGAVAASHHDLHYLNMFARYEKLHNTKSPRTLENERDSWTRFWTWIPVGRVDQATVEQATLWRDHLAKTLAARTVNDHLVRCGTVYNKLKRKRVYTGFNPFSVVDRLENDTKARDWLRPAEAVALLEQAKTRGRDLHLFVALGLYAGLRPNEILNCRWDWITWPGEAGTGWIAVPARDGDFRIKNGRARSVPLHPELRTILTFYRDSSPRAFVVAPFEKAGAGPYRWNPRKSFAACVVAAGLQGRKISPYNMRHSFASNAANASIEQYQIMDWMGHKDVRTLQIYAHMSPDNPNIERLYVAEEG